MNTLAGRSLPAETLAAISAYYRRVVIEARPMGSLVSTVMALTVVALVYGLVRGSGRAWIGGCSLGLTLAAVGLALSRTVRLSDILWAVD